MEAEDVYALSLAAEEMDLLPRCKTHQDAANRMGMHRVRLHRMLAEHGLLMPRERPGAERAGAAPRLLRNRLREDPEPAGAADP